MAFWHCSRHKNLTKGLAEEFYKHISQNDLGEFRKWGLARSRRGVLQKGLAEESEEIGLADGSCKRISQTGVAEGSRRRALQRGLAVSRSFAAPFAFL